MSLSYPQETFNHTKFTPSSFLARRRLTVRKNTLLAQLSILKSTGRYDAFRLKWHPAYNQGYKALFWDSDIAKWLEGACYFLAEKGHDDEEDKVIDDAVEGLTDMIASAQWKDGYLNIHFTVVKPGLRFTNIRDLHELYNAGHLIEAALIHHQLYGNTLLLDPVLKYVSQIHTTFGPGPEQIHGYPGHPEIELALLRLHARTGNTHAYDLAKYFITERGNPHGVKGQHFYLSESQQRGEDPGQRPAGDAWPTANAFWYQQAHKPILEQMTIEGHSVRAMYLLTAVADVVRLSRTVETESNQFEGYKSACERLWDNMVNRKMYLTGGIGAIEQWEGFGIDYFLPQSTDEGGCYAETCASIGVMMLAERMLQLDLNGKYADIMELELYNTVLGGMSQDGKEFLYENHLASCEKRPMKRESWFDCACCPPNVTKTFGMLGGYLWSYDVKGKDVEIDVHLYNSAVLDLLDIAGETCYLKQETDWPWGNSVTFSLVMSPKLDVTIKLRIPSWAQPFEDGKLFHVRSLVVQLVFADLLNYGSSHPHHPPTSPFQNATSSSSPEYTYAHCGRRMTLTFSPKAFAPGLLSQPLSTNQNTLTIARGPLIYCAEDIDNSWVYDHFKSVVIFENNKLEESIEYDRISGEKFVKVTASGVMLGDVSNETGEFPGFEIARDKHMRKTEVKVVFVPYFYRGNRGGRGHMRVGFRRL